jgi:pimeloyl-ACP methyl ester carboxylesterase/DNA-binding CsgD family transcriptional regulator
VEARSASTDLDGERHAEGILQRWASLEGMAAADEADLARLFDEDANLPSTMVSALASDPANFAVAVVGRRGELVYAEPDFAQLFADEASTFELARLGRLAGAQSAIAIAHSARDGPVAVLAMEAGQAARWPIFAERLPAAPRRTVMLAVYRPAKFDIDTLAAARAFGLTMVEALLVQGLIRADDLKAAGAQLGLGRETAKDVLRRAMRKMGAMNAAQATGRAMDLACDLANAPALAAVQKALHLSPAEARVALRIGAGDSAVEAGRRVGMTPATVKSYRRTIFNKTGVNRARHLGRLIYEAAYLARLAGFSEVVPTAEDRSLVRAVFRPGGRRVVYLDYGPKGAPAVILGHGYLTGRIAPPPMLAALRDRGLRVVVPQRPGFGLTSPSARQEDYLADCAEDLAAILDQIGEATAHILARDGGVTGALEFAQRFPRRLGAGILLNPRAPKSAPRPHDTPISAISRFLLGHPALIAAFGDMLMRQSRPDIARNLLLKTYEAFAGDAEAIRDPAIVEHLMADLVGTFACSSLGFQMEQRAYSDGWRPPAALADPRWTLALSGGLNLTMTGDLAEHPADRETIPGAGLLVQFTHAAALAELMAARITQSAPQRRGGDEAARA